MPAFPWHFAFGLLPGLRLGHGRLLPSLLLLLPCHTLKRSSCGSESALRFRCTAALLPLLPSEANHSTEQWKFRESHKLHPSLQAGLFTNEKHRLVTCCPDSERSMPKCTQFSLTLPGMNPVKFNSVSSVQAVLVCALPVYPCSSLIQDSLIVRIMNPSSPGFPSGAIDRLHHITPLTFYFAGELGELEKPFATSSAWKAFCLANLIWIGFNMIQLLASHVKFLQMIFVTLLFFSSAFAPWLLVVFVCRFHFFLLLPPTDA